MDLFVEKPINRSKLACILDQLQDQLGVPSTDCSSLDALETSLGEGQLASALCCANDLETDSTVHPQTCAQSVHTAMLAVQGHEGARDQEAFLLPDTSWFHASTHLASSAMRLFVSLVRCAELDACKAAVT